MFLVINELIDLVNPYYAALFILILVIFTFLIRKKECFQKEENKDEKYEKILNCLGEEKNIKAIRRVASRVEIELYDKKELNKEGLKENGIRAIVVTSKKVTLVVGKEAKAISDYLLLKKDK